MPATRKAHTRRHVLGREARWRCFYCGRVTRCSTCDPSVPFKFKATLDHVIPRCRGGRDSLDNLVLACEPCNNAKADYLPDTPPPPRRPKPTGCKKTTKGGIRKGFPTRQAALMMCVAVSATYDVELGAYKCLRCPDWHVNRPDQLRALSARGHVGELAFVV